MAHHHRLGPRALTHPAILLLVSLPLIGCAHRQIEREIDDKVSRTPPMTRTELQEETHRTIEGAPNLTPAQRGELLELRQKTRAEMNDYREKSLALRTLLVRETLAKELSRDELYGIRNRMKKVDDERRELLFSAVDRANRILGRDLTANPDLFEDVLGERGRP